MSAADKLKTEEWIEHEVQLRLNNERFIMLDGKHEGNFKLLQKTLDKLESKVENGFERLDAKMDSKFNTMYVSLIFAFLVPIAITIGASILTYNLHSSEIRSPIPEVPE